MSEETINHENPAIDSITKGNPIEGAEANIHTPPEVTLESLNQRIAGLENIIREYVKGDFNG